MIASKEVGMWNKDEVSGKAEQIKGRAKQAAGDFSNEATFMTRTSTGLCFVAAFGLVASLGAQTTPQRSSSTDKENVTVTGCLAKDANGNYVLNNAHLDTDMNKSGSTTG